MPGRIDTVVYSDHWASTAPIDIPVKGELDGVRKALSDHVLLLYDNPLAEGLNRAERDRFVREQLASYRLLLDTYGFVKTTVLLKKIAHQFLLSFLDLGDRLLYIPDEDIIYTPMFRSAMTLSGRSLDVTGEDGRTIQFILSWLLCLSKLPMDRPDLEKPAETAWIDRQVNPLPCVAGRETLDALRRIVGWLLDVEPHFVGNHGPGSTASGAKTVPAKNADYTPTIQSLQLAKYHVDDVPYELGKRRDSVYMSVPKDVGSLRPITKEPVETQFAQQALKFDIYQTVDTDPDCVAGRFIRFRDQRPSQDCAIRGSRRGSIWRKPSTIDLSFASDFLSLEVVTELFSGNLLHMILAGRTPDCLVGKRKVELAMYGGMGSALTFPIQTIIFAACAVFSTIVELNYLENGVGFDPEHTLSDYLDQNGFRPQYKFLERNIRVYGDDICVPDAAAERLVSLLQSLGLLVNVQKSFTGTSPVRESCGVYALMGRDITPKRYRIPLTSGMIDAQLYEALRAFANEAFHMGWKNLNRSLIRRARDNPKLMSASIAGRKSQRGKHIKLGMPGAEKSIRVGYPDQQLGDAQLLFEEDRGRDDYVGFVSTRSSIPTIDLVLHERVLGFTTFFVETEAIRDSDSEYYHLTVNYRQMAYSTKEASSEAHGSLPVGVRLKKRNVVRKVSHPANRAMVWGWAPR